MNELTKEQENRYQTFKQESTQEVGEFDFELNYDYMEIKSINFVGDRVDEINATGVNVEPVDDFILVNQNELKELFAEPIVNLDLVRKAIYTALEHTVMLRSHSLGDEPYHVSACDIADYVEVIYRHSLEEAS